jgi:hypothetical protein
MFPLNKIFKILLLIVLIISFYFFVDVIIFKNKRYEKIFSTWQFPMLFAIFLDTIY